MITIICNSCNKQIQSPSLDRNFFNVLGKDVCKPCWDKIKAKAEAQAVVKGNYTFPGYRSALTQVIAKTCK